MAKCLTECLFMFVVILHINNYISCRTYNVKVHVWQVVNQIITQYICMHMQISKYVCIIMSCWHNLHDGCMYMPVYTYILHRLLGMFSLWYVSFVLVQGLTASGRGCRMGGRYPYAVNFGSRVVGFEIPIYSKFKLRILGFRYQGLRSSGQPARVY